MPKFCKKVSLITGLTVLTLIFGLLPAVYAETDVTAKVQLIQGRLQFDRSTNMSYFDLAVKNSSDDVLLSPIKVVVDSVTPSDVTVANADGTTAAGKPYREYSVEPSTVSPGQTIPAKVLRFKNPLRKRFTYTLKVLQIELSDNLGAVQPVKPEEIVTDPATGTRYVVGQVVITPQDGVTYSQIEQLVKSLGGKIVGHINFVEIYQAEFTGATIETLNPLIDQLRENPLIQGVIINDVLSHNAESNSAYVPRDPWNENQLDQSGFPYDPSIDEIANATSWEVCPWEHGASENRIPKGNNAAVEAMRFPEAWKLAYEDKYPTINSVNVGIVDSDFPVEIDASTGYVTRHLHEDLQSFAWANASGGPDGASKDDYQHGHHVAGIIGATTNNGKGINGAAWNSTLYGYKTLLTQTDNLYGICQLILNKKVGLLNFSIGISYGDPGPQDDRDYILNNDPQKIADEKITFYTNFFRMLQKAEPNFLLVQAAGNSNVEAIFNGFASSVTEEALRKNLLIVGSFDTGYNPFPLDALSYTKSAFSNYGRQVDIMAPGGAFRDLFGYSEPYSTVYDYSDNAGGSEYTYMIGTSMAAPYITGLAAMIKQKYPGLSWPQVRQAILSAENYKTITIIDDIYNVLEKKMKEDQATCVKIADAYEALIAAGKLNSGPIPVPSAKTAILTGMVELRDNHGSIFTQEVLDNYDFKMNVEFINPNKGDHTISYDLFADNSRATFLVQINPEGAWSSVDLAVTFSLTLKPDHHLQNPIVFAPVHDHLTVDEQAENFLLYYNLQLLPTDNVIPQVADFSSQKTVVLEGEAIQLNYTVTDDTGLARVELWRTKDAGGSPDAGNWTRVNEEAVSGLSHSGMFTDTPPSVGKYWYGMHGVDIACNVANEKNRISVNVLTADGDEDGDEHANPVDLFPLDPTEWADMDSDGIGDNADPDDNNNGINDVDEVAITTPVNVKAEYQAVNLWNFITWDEVPGAVAYRLYWGTDSGVTTGSEYGGETIPPSHEFGHTGVLPGWTYYYRILAVDANGNESELSEEVFAYVRYGVDVTGTVPDTGQIASYTNIWGEDSDYTINPPSYTKLDANGADLPVSATTWTMIRDNVTGLIWENKTDDGGIHDKDNTYTWYDPNSATNGGNAGTPGNGTDTKDFIDALNVAKFGGFQDWRLPTVKELSWIVNSNIPYPGPTINTTYFQNTQGSGEYWWYPYWSSTTYAYRTGKAWGVGFGDGVVHHGGKSNSLYVRAVR